jgi:Lar family restriction alleviation protein
MTQELKDERAALLPCPFCGGSAHIERYGTPRQSCIVECDSCGLRHDSGDEDSMCGQSWNRRAAQPPAAEGAIVDYDRVVQICDAHGIGLPVDCVEMVVEIIRLAAPASSADSKEEWIDQNVSGNKTLIHAMKNIASERTAEDSAVRDKIARALHYPACWDTAAYPTLESAAWEAIACAKLGCSTCERTAEDDVPECNGSHDYGRIAEGEPECTVCTGSEDAGGDEAVLWKCNCCTCEFSAGIARPSCPNCKAGDQYTYRAEGRQCKGMNCGATDGISHSLECHAEHAAAIAGGEFAKDDTRPAPVNKAVALTDEQREVIGEAINLFARGWQAKQIGVLNALLAAAPAEAKGGKDA